MDVIMSLFTDGRTVYVGNLQEPTKKLLGPTSGHSKTAGHKLNRQKSVAFLSTSDEQVGFEITKGTIYISAPKITYLGYI